MAAAVKNISTANAWSYFAEAWASTACGTLGGYFGADRIPYFNGGLFDDDSVLPLDGADMDIIADIDALDWGAIEPSIFGTLFERGLDPSKRSQLGAHYTSKEDILLIVEPVLMAPLEAGVEGCTG